MPQLRCILAGDCGHLKAAKPHTSCHCHFPEPPRLLGVAVSVHFWADAGGQSVGHATSSGNLVAALRSWVSLVRRLLAKRDHPARIPLKQSWPPSAPGFFLPRIVPLTQAAFTCSHQDMGIDITYPAIGLVERRLKQAVMCSGVFRPRTQRWSGPEGLRHISIREHERLNLLGHGKTLAAFAGHVIKSYGTSAPRL